MTAPCVCPCLPPRTGAVTRDSIAHLLLPPLALPDVLPPKGEGLRLAVELLHPADRHGAARHGTGEHGPSEGSPPLMRAPAPGKPLLPPPSAFPGRTGRDVPSRPLPHPLVFSFRGTCVSCSAEASQPRVSPVPWNFVGFFP